MPLDVIGGYGLSVPGDHQRHDGVPPRRVRNGHRHASKGPGSVHLRLYELDESTVRLSVASDGPPIPPDVERYLFEPFFSTRSRGTGLGLYICRELCERYGASIEYRLRPPGELNRNEFQVAMQRRPLISSEARLHLTS